MLAMPPTTPYTLSLHDALPIFGNQEIQALITAIGTGIREEFDIARARYHKVIVMCDADVDGAHIRTLVLTFLFREMPDLIRSEEHTSELQSHVNLVCRLLLEKQ